MLDVKTESRMDTKLPRLVTELPGPEARRVLKLDERYISPSYTRDYPLVARTGRGAMIQDVDGNIFLDFAAGIAVCSTGHCHPQVVEAIQKQAAELVHMSGTDFYYMHMVELAERLSAVLPGDEPKRFYYGNSGTEAVEAALKLAKYHTKRDKVIAFYGAFHGRTMGSLSLTASKAVQRKGFGPMVPGVHHLPYAYCYRCAYGQTPDKCSVECGTVLEREVFKKLVDPQEVAAIVVEPVQGEGGYVPADPRFLAELRRVCSKYGIMLVSDEVQSGMGRTGKWWGGDHAGLKPDILCVAKGIASGMPLGITVARASVMDWPPGAHASTFGGNPVCIAAAIATFDLIKGKYLENARRMGEAILRRTADWPKRHRIVGDVRGHGLMIGIELVKDQTTKEKAKDYRDRVVNEAFAKGLLILGAGENTLRIAPPLVVDAEQVEFALDTIEEILTSIEKG
ncbi:MAG TPA: acetyl ornithine aminotransferase family protein [Candidatus Binatia bacterium]|nr:acetyl ornithine aminotransferase family protein [Candidatus Binatia bacterium]